MYAARTSLRASADAFDDTRDDSFVPAVLEVGSLVQLNARSVALTIMPQSIVFLDKPMDIYPRRRKMDRNCRRNGCDPLAEYRIVKLAKVMPKIKQLV
jgi:hypothetical protein